MEIMVSEKYAQKVLTDEKNFSFEHGVADVRNASFGEAWIIEANNVS